MGFIYDYKIPGSLEEFVVLVELATYLFRTSKVLHGSEIDILAAFAHQLFEFSEQFAVALRAIVIVLAVVEYLAEILKPSLIHHWTMS